MEHADIQITMDIYAEVLEEKKQEVLADFLNSKTGKTLYDKENRLWYNNPSYIAEMYTEKIFKK